MHLTLEVAAAVNLHDPLTWSSHAARRMAERQVSYAQILYALQHYHTSYLAKPRPGQAFRSMVYVGTVDGQDLLVWVKENSDPVYVTSVAWKGQDE